MINDRFLNKDLYEIFSSQTDHIFVMIYIYDSHINYVDKNYIKIYIKIDN